MTRFIVVRLLQLVLVALGVSSLLFVLLRLSGDPAAVYAGPQATPEALAAAREILGLDRPILVQYGDFVAGMMRFDFGNSFIFREEATGPVLRSIVPSLKIVGLAWLFAVFTGFVAGTVAALRNGTTSARAVMVGSFVGQSIPYFWLGIILVWIFAIKLSWLPATGTRGWQAVILPAAAISVPLVATLARLVRGELLDTLTQPYVTTARSKGLSRWRVLTRYAVPNSLPPVLAWTGIQFSFLIGSLVIIEPVFNYAGIGRLFVDGVTTRDYPLVQAGVFVVAIFVVAVNLALDVVVRLVDPRLRAGTG